MIRLETNRLILRDYTESDFEDYYRLMSDEKTMYYLQDIMLRTREEAEAEFKKILADMRDPRREYYFLRMELKKTREQVGSIGYTVTDRAPQGKTVHLGYFTFPLFWGNGYTTEAAKRVLEYAFAEDGVYRVTTGCLKENAGSEAVMLKCGLKKEAELPDHVLHDGKMKTRLEYGLTKSEWESAAEK